MRQVTMASLLVILIASPLTYAAVNRLPENCKKLIGVDYDFCLSVLGSDPRSVTADMHELTVILFEMAASKAKSNSILIKNILQNPKLDEFDRKVLEDCSSLFRGTPESLESAAKLISKKDVKKADYQGVSATAWSVMFSGGNCGNEFNYRRGGSGSGGDVTRFIHENENLMAICNLAFLTSEFESRSTRTPLH